MTDEREFPYYIAFVKDGKRLIMQVRSDKDTLSPDIFAYHGVHLTTKKYLYANRQAILRAVNRQYTEYFTSIVLD